MSIPGVATSIPVPTDSDGINQALVILSSCEAAIAGDAGRAEFAWSVSRVDVRHEEHTVALVALMCEIADRLDLPWLEVQIPVLAGQGASRELVTTCIRAVSGKPWWMASQLWARRVYEAARHLLEYYAALLPEDVDADRHLIEVVLSAKMRVYAGAV